MNALARRIAKLEVHSRQDEAVIFLDLIPSRMRRLMAECERQRQAGAEAADDAPTSFEAVPQ